MRCELLASPVSAKISGGPSPASSQEVRPRRRSMEPFFEAVGQLRGWYLPYLGTVRPSSRCCPGNQTASRTKRKASSAAVVACDIPGLIILVYVQFPIHHGSAELSTRPNRARNHAKAPEQRSDRSTTACRGRAGRGLDLATRPGGCTSRKKYGTKSYS